MFLLLQHDNFSSGINKALINLESHLVFSLRGNLSIKSNVVITDSGWDLRCLGGGVRSSWTLSVATRISEHVNMCRINTGGEAALC